MRIRIPRDFNFGMAESTSYFLNVNTFVGKQAGMAVPKLMSAEEGE